MSSSEVDDGRRDKKGRNLARPTLQQGRMFPFNDVEPASAKWMKRPIFLTSFFSINCSGSKFRTSAAI
jgi:hypothetical protein